MPPGALRQSNREAEAHHPHTMDWVGETDQGIGCRDAALATGVLLGFATALFATGLTLVNRTGCDGWCEGVGLTLLYAGGPISALVGVFTDSVVVAWPLDLMLWVSSGFMVARVAEARGWSPVRLATGVVALAVALGLVLSQLVELAV